MIQIDWSTLGHWVNDCYKPLFKNWERFNILVGGAGSGKSFFIAQRFIFRLVTLENYNLLVTRKWAVTNRFSTFALFCQIISLWNLSELFNINKSDLTITFKPNNNQVLFLGLDDREKVKSITFKSGILNAIWMEEANEFLFDDFEQLNLRLRGISNYSFQVTISFNPVSAYSWLKAHFFDQTIDSCTILKTTYKDNRFLDTAYKSQLESLKGNAYKIYALGEWGVVEGLVFKSFGESEITNMFKFIGYGLDFGFSADPAALIGIYESEDSYLLDEVIYQTKLTNNDLIKIMSDLKINRYDEIVADCAEPKSIEDIHRAGFNVHSCKKGPDSIKHGLDKMMAKNILVTPRSVNIKKELYSYSWKKDKDGRELPAPIDSFNHAIDASRYRIDYYDTKVGMITKRLPGL